MLLLATVFGTIAAVEAVTQVCFDRVSRIQARTGREWADALRPGDRRYPVVLLAGNSLLGSGVDTEALRRVVSGRVDVRRLVVEDTAYIDWQFGLRRLFAEGARPQVVVLVMSAEQLTAPTFRGDYSAYYLCRTVDLPEVVRLTRVDRTHAMSLLLAEYSEFWAARKEIRKWALNTAAPALPQLLRTLRPVPPTRDAALSHLLARERLQRLTRELRKWSAVLALAFPPRLSEDAHAPGAAEAARELSVPVIDALPAGSLPPDRFEDGYHLNPHGASEFTSALGQALIELGEQVRATPAPPLARVGTALPH